MKSIALKKRITIPCSILLILLFSLFYNFSNPEKTISKTEYLSIIVDYRQNSQLITITESTSNTRQISHKNTANTFDNRFVFKLFQQFEDEGWKLNDHSFGSIMNEYSRSHTTSYLFTK